MFNVTTVNLSPDTRTAIAGQEATALGDLSLEEFSALLERLREIDPVQNHEADPHLLVTSRAGKFIVRTGQGKLLLYDARDTTAPYAELTTGDIIAHLDRPSSLTDRLDPSADALAREAARTPSRGIAAAILIAGLLLNGYTLYSVFYTESVNEKPTVILLTEPAELSARLSDAVGTYATGSQPGDRVIVISVDGKIKFLEVGSRNSLSDSSDTFRIGRHDTKLCLATAENGVIDVLNIDTLIYYRDIYKRTSR